MNKYLLLAALFVVSIVAGAQQDKYLAGAVPEIGGKVVFEKTIVAKQQVTDDQLYTLLDKWAKENYGAQTEYLKNRILISNPQTREVACAGEKYLVFKKGALVLDQAKMSYQLIMEIEGGKCDVTVRGIKYLYSDSKELQSAEDLITDKVAINKKGDKLNRYYDKFRTHTVDSINSIFRSIDVYLNGISTVGAAAQQPGAISVAAQPSQPAQVVPAEQKKEEPIAQISHVTLPSEPDRQTQPVAAGGSMPGYRQVSADKIPGNYVKLLGDWTLITSGTPDQMNVMTASWGGLGMFWEKPVVFCFLNPTRYSVKTMDKGDTYTISFYTEAYKDNLRYCGSVSGSTTDKIKGSGLTPIKTPSGATAFSEAWMIIECKKMVSQQLSADAVMDKSLPNEWTKDGYHKMYIGEILNVWIK